MVSSIDICVITTLPLWNWVDHWGISALCSILASCEVLSICMAETQESVLRRFTDNFALFNTPALKGNMGSQANELEATAPLALLMAEKWMFDVSSLIMPLLIHWAMLLVPHLVLLWKGTSVIHFESVSQEDTLEIVFSYLQGGAYTNVSRYNVRCNQKKVCILSPSP